MGLPRGRGTLYFHGAAGRYSCSIEICFVGGVPHGLKKLCSQAAHQIGLLKPGSSVAAGPSAHEVAVGDAAGIVWLYDLRQPDAPTLRLPCNSGNAVSCIQWTAQQRAAADARGSRRSSGASPTSLTPNLGEVPSGLPSSGTHARRGSSAAESGVPRAPTSSATRDSPSHIGV